jgi:hypothetical protein
LCRWRRLKTLYSRVHLPSGSDQGSKKYECQITRKGKRYYWVSRGNRELIRSNSGDFVYFISPEGTGYIKIHVGAGKEPYSYMEHLTSGFKNMTYWGSSSGLKQ